jgi:hypothetical protein
MSSDNQFTALGPTVIGFQTNGSNIDQGVNASGKLIGVVGTGPFGVQGHGGKTGVQGDGDDFGVVGNGRKGMEGSAGTNKPLAGVSGVARNQTIPGDTVCGVGVLGFGEGNRAAVFQTGRHGTPSLVTRSSSNLVAQVHIVPLDTLNPPPDDGLAGDLFVKKNEGANTAQLWFCTKNGPSATWKLIA